MVIDRAFTADILNLSDMLRFTEVEGETSNGQTIRTIARKADVRQDHALPENGMPPGDRRILAATLIPNERTSPSGSATATAIVSAWISNPKNRTFFMEPVPFRLWLCVVVA